MKDEDKAYTMNETEEFERACCICSYHVYKDIWEVAIGEELAMMLLSLVAFATGKSNCLWG